MKIKWDDLIAAFAVGVIIGFLLGNSFSSPSSEARPSPCSKGWAGFIASRNVEPKRQITETQRWVRSGRRAILPSQNYKVGKQQSRLGLFEIIRRAADRNNCYGEDYLILLAIRKAENGGPGKEFGVKAVWDTDLETQAAEAAATVVKNRARWNEAGRPPDFISFLGDRYVPKEDDPEGNINFKKNVRFWFRRFKNENRNNRQIKSGLFG